MPWLHVHSFDSLFRTRNGYRHKTLQCCTANGEFADKMVYGSVFNVIEELHM